MPIFTLIQCLSYEEENYEKYEFSLPRPDGQRWTLVNVCLCWSEESLRRAPVRTSYFIDTIMLQHVEEIRDLGVKLTLN